MAMAVQRLHKDAQVTIGPWIDRGFYYDFDLPTPLSDKELKVCWVVLGWCGVLGWCAGVVMNTRQLVVGVAGLCCTSRWWVLGVCVAQAGAGCCWAVLC